MENLENEPKNPGRASKLRTLFLGHMNLWLLAFSLLSGAVLGLCLSGKVAEDGGFLRAVSWLSDGYVTLLRYVAGPLIFLCLLESICGMGDLSTFGSLGRRALFRFLSLLLLAGFFAVLFSALVFGLPRSSEASVGQELSEVLKLFLNFLPRSPWGPFLQGNVLQISFMAVVLGFVLLLFGKRATPVFAVIHRGNQFFLLLIRYICKLIPLYVFLAVLRLFLSGADGALLGVWRLIPVYLALMIVLSLFVLLRTARRSGKPVREIYKNLFPPFFIALTTANSTMAIDAHLEAAKNNGVDEKTARFCVPLALSIFKPASVMYLAVIACYFAKTGGAEISLFWLLSATVVTTVLTLSIPPVPGGGVNVYLILFTHLAIPADGATLAVVIALDAFMEFIITGFNNFSQPPEILNLSLPRIKRGAPRKPNEKEASHEQTE